MSQNQPKSCEKYCLISHMLSNWVAFLEIVKLRSISTSTVTDSEDSTITTSRILRTIRRLEAMDGTQAAEEPPQVFFKKRSAKSKTSFRKKAPTPPPATSSDSDFSSSDDEESKRIKRRRKNATVTASSASAPKARTDDLGAESASAPLPLAPSNDATKQSNWYDEGKEDELNTENLLGKTRARPGTDSAPDGTYKGAANYQSFIQKNPNATQKQVGPIKAPTNIRTITVTDFSPDLCKDFKVTGYVAFPPCLCLQQELIFMKILWFW